MFGKCNNIDLNTNIHCAKLSPIEDEEDSDGTFEEDDMEDGDYMQDSDYDDDGP